MSDSSVTDLVVVNGKVRPVLPQTSSSDPVAVAGGSASQALTCRGETYEPLEAYTPPSSAPAAHVIPALGQLPSCEERLRRAARYTSDALELGSDTTRRLCAQGEHLAPMAYTLDNTDYELKQGHRLVRGMTSWTGMFKNWFTRSPKPPERPTALTAPGNAALTAELGGSPWHGSTAVHHRHHSRSTSKKTRGSRGRSEGSEADTASSSYALPGERHEGESYAELQRRHAARAKGMNAREEQLLDILHEDVRRLGEQALVQQELLTQQNAQLDVIHDKTEKVHNRVEKVSRRVKEAL